MGESDDREEHRARFFQNGRGHATPLAESPDAWSQEFLDTEGSAPDFPDPPERSPLSDGGKASW